MVKLKLKRVGKDRSHCVRERAPVREVLTEVKPEQPKHETFGPGDYIQMGDRYISWERMMSE